MLFLILYEQPDYSVKLIGFSLRPWSKNNPQRTHHYNLTLSKRIYYVVAIKDKNGIKNGIEI